MSECWYFARALSKAGYGVIWNGEKVVLAHRFMYESVVGEIPKGLELDHLCRNRSCINPEHLEPVTRRENTVRGLAPIVNGMLQKNKTHCPRGHEYNEENTYIRRDRPSHRDCRKCRSEARQRFELNNRKNKK